MKHNRRPVPRHVRLSAQFTQMIAEWLIRDGDSPWNDRLTITRVELTADGSLARVFVLDRLEGQPDVDLKEGVNWLKDQAGELRGRIGRELRLRRVPHLQFRYDEAWSGAAALGETFVRIAEQSRSEGEGAEGKDEDGA